MPGSSSELETEIDDFKNSYPINEIDSDTQTEWCPRLLVEFLDILHSVLQVLQPPKSPNPFTERFKYDIISSSLLSPTLQTPHHRSVRTPPIPGKLKLHSRNSSVDTTYTVPPTINAPLQEPSYITPSFVVAAVGFYCLTGHMLLALISSTAVALLWHSVYVMNDSSKTDMTPCLTSLNELIAASDAWGSAIKDAVASIEVEDQSLLYGSTFASSSPTPSIRVALHSSLLTTQNQCDNVRQLFYALTSATELPQLSEMYAPTFNKLNHPLSDANTRPLSLPTSQNQSRWQDPRLNKRSTWNGSYTTLSNQVGPLPHFLRRRGKRRSDMSSMLQDNAANNTLSAPATPSISSPNNTVSDRFSSVREEVGNSGELPILSKNQYPDIESFSATALALHRSLKAEAADVFRPSSPDPSTPHRRSWMPFTISSGSRLSPQNSRHPLSLHTIQNAVQSALASKRYACAHLLALRFSEDEDEGYWEDVRSVMALLTTTLSDASSRLIQAMEDYERSKLRDHPLTPLSEADDGSQDQRRSMVSSTSSPRESRIFSKATFAPMPGPFARFGAHVAAISSALEDAEGHLERCVVSVKEGDSDEFATCNRQKSGIASHADTINLHDEHPALQAYERLRRELGLALRECERGRECLLEIIRPPTDPAAHDSDLDDIPPLGHDTSDDSDKPGPRSLSDGEEGDIVMNRATLAAFLDSKISDERRPEKDDVTEHLLLSASPQHLPPALGIEQVFEAEATPMGSFTRERLRLTREERIKLMKARRGGVTSGGHEPGLHGSGGDKEGSEKWGPGGEVVQELKDVIWKVCERRRKIAESLDLRVEVAPTIADYDTQMHQPSDDVGDFFISASLDGDLGLLQETKGSS
ncbi:hypothetical protein AX15_001014 [Amanita polypyramis BW_CC]|nr:hypothetical protein AX15_001014 [Amanita polypyramis BW_CC]